jgi:hypothetical protein
VKEDVDGRDKPGHDDVVYPCRYLQSIEPG